MYSLWQFAIFKSKDDLEDKTYVEDDLIITERVKTNIPYLIIGQTIALSKEHAFYMFMDYFNSELTSESENYEHLKQINVKLLVWSDFSYSHGLDITEPELSDSNPNTNMIFDNIKPLHELKSYIPTKDNASKRTKIKIIKYPVYNVDFYDISKSASSDEVFTHLIESQFKHRETYDKLSMNIYNDVLIPLLKQRANIKECDKT